MKKLLTALAALAALLVVAVAALSLPPPDRRGPPVVGPACRGEGPLRAGAAVEPLFPPPSPSIAGFPRLTWAADGQRDPLAARALVLAEPGCAVGLVSLEMLLVPEALARAVEARGRALGLDLVVVAATHTHAGFGGYWDSAPGGRMATGPWDPAAFEALLGAASRALSRAREALAPAALEAGVGDARALVFNRDDAELDGRLVSVRLTGAGGAPLAEVALLGSHPTILGGRNRKLSGDWPGALMRSAPAPLLLFQGALGDQTTHGNAGEAATPESYAAAVAALLAALPRSAPERAPALAAARAAVPLPPAAPGAVPAPLRRAVGRLFGGALPAGGEVTALRLGPLLLLASPAEPTARVAAGWRAAAGPGAEVLSLAGPYAGYVETPERMARGEGETPRTYYGPELSARLEEALGAAAAALRQGSARR